MLNYCFDRLLRLRIEREVVEVMFGKEGENGLVVKHAVDDGTNLGSRGPQ
jgi:hypothetical protein